MPARSSAVRTKGERVSAGLVANEGSSSALVMDIGWRGGARKARI
jgi:hypothetical protein